jgi:hypothetical protein
MSITDKQRCGAHPRSPRRRSSEGKRKAHELVGCPSLGRLTGLLRGDPAKFPGKAGEVTVQNVAQAENARYSRRSGGMCGPRAAHAAGLVQRNARQPLPPNTFLNFALQR